MSYIYKKAKIGLLLIGIGLIVLGAVLFILLSPKSDWTGISRIPVEVEFPAPALELLDLHGRPVSLDEKHGLVVLVNLWATWCPPCRAEMPTLQAFYEKYRGQGFEIIGINDGEPESLIIPFIKELRLTFPIWLDEDYETEKVFGTINLPSTYVIDRAGIVRLIWIGAIDRLSLEKYVAPIITE